MPPLRRWPIAGVTAIVVVLAASCSDDGDPPTPIELRDGDGPAVTEEEPDTAAPGEDGPAEDPGADDPGEMDDDASAQGDGDASRDAEAAAAGLADLTVAEPGTWPVGDAGRVTFELEGRDLVLDDLDVAAGWDVEVVEQDDDEIELLFRRDRVSWRFSVERSGRHLEVEIEQHTDQAGTGGYDLGDAGTFAFDVDDGRLVLTSLEVAQGWTVRDRDEDDDQIELELRADDHRRVDVEVELDAGAIELEIEYRVRSRF